MPLLSSSAPARSVMPASDKRSAVITRTLIGRSLISESFFVAPVAEILRYGCLAAVTSTVLSVVVPLGLEAASAAAGTESAAHSDGLQARQAAAGMAQR